MAPLFLWLLLAAAYPGHGGGEDVTIASAGEEEGTLVLADGRSVRLIGIARAEEGALGGFAGATARLHAGEGALSRYGQILAHIVLDDGRWLQETLVQEGKALAMPVYETRSAYLAPLLAAEEAAREDKAGMWAQPKRVIVCADDAKRAFDRYALVRGRVVKAATVGGVTYLNFGEDYRKDFTVKISARALKAMPENVRALSQGAEGGALIEARGYVFYNGGPMIEAKTPAQITLIEGEATDREEICP